MRNKLIRILIKLLEWLSNDRIGVIYRSDAELKRRKANYNAFDIVCKVVEAYYGMPFSEIIQKTRKRNVLEKRQMLQFLAYTFTGLSTVEIGNETNQDHATVLHSKKVIYDMLDTDEKTRIDYKNLREIINQELVRRTSKHKS